ncbi:MAG: hypothetical protein E6G27_17310 [Actinobacteria bacterium]|nr:MAG: hypothetical protein E6G27_17310 [Actinomycetota bacterium]
MRKLATLVAVVAVATTACGGGGGQSPASARVEITRNWEALFSQASTVETKVTDLQNGVRHRPTIETLVNSPLTKGTEAKVREVILTSGAKPPSAVVRYDILVSGKPVTANPFSGTALRLNGRWVMAEATLCGLVSLAGAPPADCQPAKK